MFYERALWVFTLTLFSFLSGCAGMEMLPGEGPKAKIVRGFEYEPDLHRAKVRVSGGALEGYFLFDRAKHRSSPRYGYRNPKLEDWMQYPTSLPQLASEMNRRTRARCEMAGRTVPLDDPAIHKMPLLFLSGGRQVLFNETEKTNLEEYLTETGGFLWVDDINATTSSPFYRSFLDLLDTILPTSEPVPLPNDHPLFHMKYHFEGTPVLRAISEGTGCATCDELQMTAGIVGFEYKGRLVAILDAVNYVASWESPPQDDFIRKSPTGGEEGIELGVNVLLYVLAHSPMVFREGEE